MVPVSVYIFMFWLWSLICKHHFNIVAGSGEASFNNFIYRWLDVAYVAYHIFFFNEKSDSKVCGEIHVVFFFFKYSMKYMK